MTVSETRQILDLSRTFISSHADDEIVSQKIKVDVANTNLILDRIEALRKEILGYGDLLSKCDPENAEENTERTEIYSYLNSMLDPLEELENKIQPLQRKIIDLKQLNHFLLYALWKALPRFQSCFPKGFDLGAILKMPLEEGFISERIIEKGVEYLQNKGLLNAYYGFVFETVVQKVEDIEHISRKEAEHFVSELEKLEECQGRYGKVHAKDSFETLLKFIAKQTENPSTLDTLLFDYISCHEANERWIYNHQDYFPQDFNLQSILQKPLKETFQDAKDYLKKKDLLNAYYEFVWRSAVSEKQREKGITREKAIDEISNLEKQEHCQGRYGEKHSDNLAIFLRFLMNQAHISMRDEDVLLSPKPSMAPSSTTHQNQVFRARGFRNLGNTCFANALLKSLFYNQSFMDLVHAVDQNHLKTEEKALYDLFVQLYTKLQQGEEVDEALNTFLSHSHWHQEARLHMKQDMEDPHQMMIYLKNFFHLEDLDEYGFKISQIYNDSHTDQGKRAILEINVSDLNSASNPQQLLEQELAPEQLEGGIKQQFLTSIPTAFTMRLPRFRSYKTDNGHIVLAKRSDAIQGLANELFLPIHLEGQGIIYYKARAKPTGFVCHHGPTIHSGHYTTLIPLGNGVWEHHNDSCVSQLSEEEAQAILQTDAYLIQYETISTFPN